MHPMAVHNEGAMEGRNLEADRRVREAEDRAREAEDRAREAQERLQELEMEHVSQSFPSLYLIELHALISYAVNN